MARCAALIVAAGSGRRFGGDVPKQYRQLAGIAVLRRTVEAFLLHPAVDQVQVVIDPDRRDLYDRSVRGLSVLAPVSGGESRQDSVRNGLEALGALPDAPDYVMIHDGARPLIDAATIDRTLDALDKGPGAIAAVPVTDTLKRADAEGHSAGTVSRDGLWRAQTPQSFHLPKILDAHRKTAGQGLTDDAAVAEAVDLPVALILGSDDNLKITTEDDLDRAELLWAGRQGMLPAGSAAPDPVETRVGCGFDVHKFGPGTFVTLCGLEVPHTAGLVGHSDADVGLHTITDALLGALGDGDIGTHFPPSDPRWKGADSAQFLEHSAHLVRKAGGRIIHVDLVLMCEQPKLKPLRPAMRKRVSEILDIPEHRVSLKATTTEKLGFTGRQEGIAAMATATITLPAA